MRLTQSFQTLRRRIAMIKEPILKNLITLVRVDSMATPTISSACSSVVEVAEWEEAIILAIVVVAEAVVPLTLSGSDFSCQDRAACL